MINLFVKFDRVPGTETGARQGWLKALSYTLNLNLNRKELTLTREVDAASQKLFLLASNGEHIPNVIIEAERDDKTIWRFELSDVLISGYSTSQGDLMTEVITLDYMTFKYNGLPVTGRHILAGAVTGAARSGR